MADLYGMFESKFSLNIDNKCKDFEKKKLKKLDEKIWPKICGAFKTLKQAGIVGDSDSFRLGIGKEKLKNKINLEAKKMKNDLTFQSRLDFCLETIKKAKILASYRVIEYFDEMVDRACGEPDIGYDKWTEHHEVRRFSEQLYFVCGEKKYLAGIFGFFEKLEEVELLVVRYIKLIDLTDSIELHLNNFRNFAGNFWIDRTSLFHDWHRSGKNEIFINFSDQETSYTDGMFWKPGIKLKNSFPEYRDSEQKLEMGDEYRTKFYFGKLKMIFDLFASLSEIVKPEKIIKTASS